MKTILSALLFYIFSSTLTLADSISIATLPPSVIKTTPTSGASGVDAQTTKNIYVTYSKPMLNQSWSLVQLSEASLPETTADPFYSNDMTTLTIPVQLEPNKTYAIWLNADNFQNFKSTDNQPAVPYLLVFETK